MSDDSQFGLEQIQKWMQAVIVHPLGIEQGLASDDARRHVDVDAAHVEQVVTRSTALSAVERLGIYGYAYYARLLECLKEEFPAVLAAVGEDAFASFALGYLQQYPSRSYTLFELGASFPRYLAETRPPADDENGAPGPDVPEEDAAAASWMQFVIELATFERTVGEVFDGPGPEEGQMLAVANLAAVGGEQFLTARLIGVECLRLLSTEFPVDEFYKAARRKEEIAPPEPEQTFLAVSRASYTVCHHRLSKTGYALLSALLAGDSVGDAIELVAGASDAEADELAANLQDWFAAWAARGYFRSLEQVD
jgi:hypothetical protein